MALEGQLSDFNLAEILQLIASQQKSGFLTLEAQREMVFIFDKGEVISTRDRRSRTRDPLESFLKAYGFFSESQWKHIDYVKKNSSLDLTEILVSENLLTEARLESTLRSLAQDMTHQGMKLHRGRYHFTPTQRTPPGVRGSIRLPVQSLLMEAARRLDEEPGLKAALPSQSLTFSQGEKTLPQEALSEVSGRIMKLALAGLPLGRIIRQGQVESFVVRDLLKTWLEEGFLTVEQHAADDGDARGDKRALRGINLNPGLRRAPLVLLVFLLLCGAGWYRWVEEPAMDPGQGPQLRETQLRAEVVAAARLYFYQEGQWPENLASMVRGGHMAPATLATVESLGWNYELDKKQNRFALGT